MFSELKISSHATGDESVHTMKAMDKIKGVDNWWHMKNIQPFELAILNVQQEGHSMCSRAFLSKDPT